MGRRVAALSGEGARWFPEQTTDGVVPFKVLRAAVDRELEPGKPIDLGVDIAHRHAKLHVRDLMEVTGHIVRAIREASARAGQERSADMGWGPFDRPIELKRQREISADIVAVNVGEGPRTKTGEERSLNLRAELNCQMRERRLRY